MNVDHGGQNVSDATEVVGSTTNNVDHRDKAVEGQNPEDDDIPQPLPSPSNQNSKGRETPRETLAPNSPDDQCGTGNVRWNNTGQGRHWCFTFNDYSPTDLSSTKQRLTEGEGNKIVSAIVREEAGESGAPHLQGHIHFKTVLCQTGILWMQQTVHASFSAWKRQEWQSQWEAPCCFASSLHERKQILHFWKELR